MKKLILLSLVGMLTVACSSTQEKYDKKRASVEADRQEQIDEANKEYKEEQEELQKEEAGEMIDEGEEVKIKRGDDSSESIQIED